MKYKNLFLKFLVVCSSLVSLFFVIASSFVYAQSNNILSENVKSDLFTHAEQSWIEENSPLKIGLAKDRYPYSDIDINGDYIGINIDLVKLLGEETDIKFQFLSTPWSKSGDLVKTKTVDMLMGERPLTSEQLSLNSSKPYMQRIESFFTHRSLANQLIQTFATKRIITSHYTADLDDLLGNYPDITIFKVDSLSEAVKAVQEGRADILYENHHVLSHFLSEQRDHSFVPMTNPFNSKRIDLNFSYKTSQPILESILNKLIILLTQEQIDNVTHKYLTSTYKINNYDFNLNDEELAYLHNNREVTMTGDPDWLPYEGLDKDGNYVGIVPEFLNIFEQRLGIKINRVIGDSWQESLLKYKNKEVHIISETSNSLLDEDTIYSGSYLSSPIVMLMRSDHNYVNDIESISHLQMSIIKDYGYVKSIKDAYPQQNFTEFRSITDGIKAVATGETDVLLATLAQASYYMAKIGSNNVRIVGSTNLSTDLALGVHNKDKVLVSIFNKVLHSITPAEKQEILNRWGDEKFIAHVDYILVFNVFIIALVIIILIIIWYQRLLREIKARQEAEAHYKILLNLLPTQVMIIDENGIIVSANRKVFNDYATNTDKFLGKEFVTLLDFPCSFLEFLKDNVKEDRIQDLTITFKLPTEVRSMMLSMDPITFNNEPAYLILAVDISERVLMEKATIEAKNAAIEANNAKTSFLANMSHEIRTPMNAIIGFTELLFDQVKEPKLISYVKTIRTAGSSLLLLINDILDLSKIEVNKIDIKHNKTLLYRMIKDIGLIFEVDIKNKGLDFIIEIDDNVPKVVLLDEVRLRQVLINIVGNAVKFTPKGFIHLHVTLINVEHNRSDISFSITDTGIGIEQDQHELIFDSFTQPKEQNHELHGGTGLGLSISKGLIELMNSQLKVISTLGKGSTFSFILNDVEWLPPVDQQITELVSDTNNIKFNNIKVLVADDVDYNRQLLMELLPQYDIIVDTAINGLEAVEKVKKIDYDLIFLDIRMPEVNGYKAAKYIKEFNPKIPIIAFTASVMFSEAEINQRNGFDGYLRKPILKKDVISELKHHFDYTTDKAIEAKTSDTTVDMLIAEDKLFLLRSAFLDQSKKVISKNNINEIEQLIFNITQFAIKEELSLLNDFCRDWATSVDAFDVIDIQRYGKEFIELIDNLN